ncbi:hypothetical protein CONLIGDRAFT_642581 [Coniochaeta ligniaria NRRL 30616]|uniref:Uncharacterized protein n=1 Tax=Coniochaeta ligniaria NRRL 30616 TaxID=1408157 RepID=A0A1J7IT24_9PEZI|nr:hypothetical protein CONLIGDRAFT_642581 [Coniochaeta ligniaria NRRL 30616]
MGSRREDRIYRARQRELFAYDSDSSRTGRCEKVQAPRYSAAADRHQREMEGKQMDVDALEVKAETRGQGSPRDDRQTQPSSHESGFEGKHGHTLQHSAEAAKHAEATRRAIHRYDQRKFPTPRGLESKNDHTVHNAASAANRAQERNRVIRPLIDVNSTHCRGESGTRHDLKEIQGDTSAVIRAGAASQIPRSVRDTKPTRKYRTLVIWKAEAEETQRYKLQSATSAATRLRTCNAAMQLPVKPESNSAHENNKLPLSRPDGKHGHTLQHVAIASGRVYELRRTLQYGSRRLTASPDNVDRSTIKQAHLASIPEDKVSDRNEPKPLRHQLTHVSQSLQGDQGEQNRGKKAQALPVAAALPLPDSPASNSSQSHGDQQRRPKLVRAEAYRHKGTVTTEQVVAEEVASAVEGQINGLNEELSRYWVSGREMTTTADEAAEKKRARFRAAVRRVWLRVVEGVRKRREKEVLASQGSKDC